MSKLLYIQSSIFSDEGQSSKLAERFIQNWLAAHPGSEVVRRDLAADPVPHLDAQRFGAFTTPEPQRTVEQQAVIRFSDALVQELAGADVVVLGVPMYNLGVPSTLRAYFDHVARAGVTFRYTANGPEGLLTGKKAVIFSTRGGYYGTDDHSSSYVRDFLGFLGIRDVKTVIAEGLAVGEAQKETALDAARQQIAQLG
jgi:FMN-dependent NADH-azoreductase